MKYDPSGNVVWAKRAGGSGNDVGLGIAVDASGNCYVTGKYTSTTASITATVGTSAGTITVAASNGCGIGPARSFTVISISPPAPAAWHHLGEQCSLCRQHPNLFRRCRYRGDVLRVDPSCQLDGQQHDQHPDRHRRYRGRQHHDSSEECLWKWSGPNAGSFSGNAAYGYHFPGWKCAHSGRRFFCVSMVSQRQSGFRGYRSDAYGQPERQLLRRGYRR